MQSAQASSPIRIKDNFLAQERNRLSNRATIAVEAHEWSGVRSGLKPIYLEVSHGQTYACVHCS
jgi:hypothetical protein